MEDPVQNPTQTPSTLTYEETPILEPVSGHPPATVPLPVEKDDPSSVVPEAAQVFGSQPSIEEPRVVTEAVMPPPKKSKKPHIGTVLFIVLLFGLGVWLSSQLRSFFAPAVSNETIVPTLAPSVGSLRPTLQPSASSSGVASSSAWKTLEVLSGATKQPIAGISYQLPSSVTAPACDSSSCSSQGTNLPGGTRFTVAARGKGQLLPDFRGAILTDAAGREFVMKQTMIGTQYVYEYVGDFTGRTGGGYTFTKMRGALVPVSETLAIEFNHFASSGVTTDFAADDKLFDSIIKSFKGSAPVVTVAPTVKPTVSLPSSTPVATSTGF